MLCRRAGMKGEIMIQRETLNIVESYRKNGVNQCKILKYILQACNTKTQVDVALSIRHRREREKKMEEKNVLCFLSFANMSRSFCCVLEYTHLFNERMLYVFVKQLEWK